MTGTKVAIVAVVLLTVIAALSTFGWPFRIERASQASVPENTNVTASPKQLPAAGTALRAGQPSSDKPSASQKREAVPIASPRTWPAISLPPIDTPVGDVVAQLKAAADSGHPQAACRIGMELAHCWHQRVMAEQLQRSDEWRRRRPEVNPTPPPEGFASFEASVRRELDRCKTLNENELSEGWRYLLQAALGGNSSAMAEFVSRPPLHKERFLDHLEGWQAYSDHAQMFLERALEAGNRTALSTAYFASLDRQSPSGGGGLRFGNKYFAAIKYGTALLATYQGVPDSNATRQVTAQLESDMKFAASNLTPEQLSQARVEGVRLYERHFANKPPVTPKVDPQFAERSKMLNCANPLPACFEQTLELRAQQIKRLVLFIQQQLRIDAPPLAQNRGVEATVVNCVAQIAAAIQLVELRRIAIQAALHQPTHEKVRRHRAVIGAGTQVLFRAAAELRIRHHQSRIPAPHFLQCTLQCDHALGEFLEQIGMRVLLIGVRIKAAE